MLSLCGSLATVPCDAMRLVLRSVPWWMDASTIRLLAPADGPSPEKGGWTGPRRLHLEFRPGGLLLPVQARRPLAVTPVTA